MTTGAHSAFRRGSPGLGSATPTRSADASAGGVIDTTNQAIQRVAILGNHLPRHCGIATFTTDLADALVGASPALDCLVLAMNDAGRHHVYPPRVRFELAESDLTSYRRAADFLNVNTVDVVSLQHEYGIFGGKAGSHVLSLLRDLRMPVVTTLHTILATPDLLQRRAMDELIALSDRVVVMTARGATLLREVHGTRPEKIEVIPHGIPALSTGAGSKERLGVDGRLVILTFGLLSPDKGIEYVIDAMPQIVARHPNAVYIVLGATHPHVKEHHGETYRLWLESRARKLGVESHIIFHDRFVSQHELAEFVAAADIYVTPYLKLEQITSGTLAYAVGAGKAVLSTPYVYARELLADGRGILVPCRDSGAIAAEVIGLFDDEGKRSALQARAAEHGRSMVWPAVAASYLRSFEAARAGRAARLRSGSPARTLARGRTELPTVTLQHLSLMTDDTGVLQHAVFTVPRRGDGYCIDDNARGLLLMAHLEDQGTQERALVHALASRYLSFVEHALNREHGRFRNFMTYARHWTEEYGSEDSHGRALFALGTVVGRACHTGRQSLCRHLFGAALPATLGFTSPRAWAFTLLGIDEYLRAYQGDSSVQSVRAELAGKLLGLHRRTSGRDWPWFEDSLTYDNARLPQALLVSGSGTPLAAEMSAVGLRALEWLWSIQRAGESFAPIGSNGFYPRGGIKARFDQQPVDAAAMVSALLEAHRLTGDELWSKRARRVFEWFVGENQLQQSLYDASTGGCRDGLHEDRLNENQGAESTLSFLLALAELRSSDRILLSKPSAAPESVTS